VNTVPLSPWVLSHFVNLPFHRPLCKLLKPPTTLPKVKGHLGRRTPLHLTKLASFVPSFRSYLIFCRSTKCQVDQMAQHQFNRAPLLSCHVLRKPSHRMIIFMRHDNQHNDTQLNDAQHNSKKEALITINALLSTALS
jgi:hypothetical protein